MKRVCKQKEDVEMIIIELFIVIEFTIMGFFIAR